MTGLSSRDGIRSMWALWCPTCGWAVPGDSCRHQRQVIAVAPNLDHHALAMALDLADVLHNRYGGSPWTEDNHANHHDGYPLVSEWLRNEVAVELLYHDMWRVR